MVVWHPLAGTPVNNRHMKRRLQMQDFVVLFFLLFSIIFMTVVNALAAQRIPSTEALPDVIHDYFNVAGKIRTSPSFGDYQFSNIVCLVFGVCTVITAITFRRVYKIRKTLIIYAVMATFRALTFWVTSLPPPCAGYPDCPCANSEYMSRLKAANPIVVAMSWTIGLGMFSTYPQCGDLIISGHTMFMWITMRSLTETYSSVLSTHSYRVLLAMFLIIVFSAAIYIILARNHYTIDVLFGIVIPELLYQVYSDAEKIIETTEGEKLSWHQAAIRWIETY